MTKKEMISEIQSGIRDHDVMQVWKEGRVMNNPELMYLIPDDRREYKIIMRDALICGCCTWQVERKGTWHT